MNTTIEKIRQKPRRTSKDKAEEITETYSYLIESCVRHLLSLAKGELEELAAANRSPKRKTRKKV